MKFILLFFIAVFFLFSCDDPQRATIKDLINTSWRLEMIGNKKLSNGTRSTLEFSKNNRISGMAGCNRYFGSYELNDKGFKVGKIGLTKMICPEPLMRHENNYISIISNATGVRFSDGKLYISNSDKKTLQLSKIDP